MSKVGILTFHCQYNYGSALQAYALQKAVESLGAACTILNYVFVEDMKKSYGIRWNGSLKVVVFDLLLWPFYQIRKRNFHQFQKNNFNLSPETEDWKELSHLSRDLDVLICGSDQIWRPEFNSTPVYFLPFASTSQIKASYAPSIAVKKLKQESIEWYRNNLVDFNYISTREQDAAEQLSTALGRKVDCVLDPTLLHDRSLYDRVLGDFRIDLPAKYIFVSCLTSAELSVLRPFAEKLAKEKNLSIVYYGKVPITNRYYKKNIFIYGPEAFLYTIKNAEYIISNSFHACAFSILYKKTFFVSYDEEMDTRASSLFGKLEIEDRNIRHKTILEIPELDYEKVYMALKRERESSWSFLRTILNANQ